MIFASWTVILQKICVFEAHSHVVIHGKNALVMGVQGISISINRIFKYAS